ncbi:DUF1642 domain-containing protein [Lactococcus lactis]|uniref:DUF1642 domain-containing protein n=1 Tax=Lactococcus lactis TaxID=1358 RepID=UPI002078CFF4|nr:DUF1642 domain-containing protein [Lactococcus lactis]USI47476.1 DUF1642 domain-containing protein [Lactococcus lactis]
MTKFEEVKRPDNGPITELNNSMQSVLSQYRKMREYADYLEYDSKQKDEHILKLENENSFMRDERTTFDSSGMAVEPKLQQQTLPVVPEWLDIEIKYFKSTSKHPTVDVVFGVADAIVAVKNGNTHSKLYDYLFCGKQDVCNQHQAIFARAWLDGYTVEKPQLFYLKNKLTGFYLFKAFGGKYGEEFYRSTINLTDDFKFTQQEISNMETGSYEQIEVVQ